MHRVPSAVTRMRTIATGMSSTTTTTTTIKTLSASFAPRPLPGPVTPARPPSSGHGPSNLPERRSGFDSAFDNQNSPRLATHDSDETLDDLSDMSDSNGGAMLRNAPPWPSMNLFSGNDPLSKFSHTQAADAHFAADWATEFAQFNALLAQHIAFQNANWPSDTHAAVAQGSSASQSIVQNEPVSNNDGIHLSANPQAFDQSASSVADGSEFEESLEDEADSPAPPFSIQPQPLNLGLMEFLQDWAHQARVDPSPAKRLPPHLFEVHKQFRAEAKDINYADLMGDKCDLQGLDWSSMETTRRAARARRFKTYRNYVNIRGSDLWTVGPREGMLPPCESFFRFRRMHFRQDPHLAHFQLRSVLTCPTRTKAYYTTAKGINRVNLATGKTEGVMRLQGFPAISGVISTIDAGCGVLMGGTFTGRYCLKPLDSEDQKVSWEGQICTDGITNHLNIHTTRTSHKPVASVSSNDHGLRMMDLESETVIAKACYPFALNCSAISPDKRLRVVVGDHTNVLITNAETGETLQELTGHEDCGFACDWSENGWSVATGFQDRAVKIWDARKWRDSQGVSSPLFTIRTEMAGVRGLRFSPVGSDHPVLVAVEESDFVNMIDGQNFASKQVVDIFSEIGGIAFTNEGRDLNVLCCDKHRGGLLQLERCGQLYGSMWNDRPPDSWRREEDDKFLGSARDLHRLPTYLQGPKPF